MNTPEFIKRVDGYEIQVSLDQNYPLKEADLGSEKVKSIKEMMESVKSGKLKVYRISVKKVGDCCDYANSIVDCLGGFISSSSKAAADEYYRFYFFPENQTE